jgi:hypothetical protein
MASAVLENSIIGKGIVLLEDNPREQENVGNALKDCLSEMEWEANFLFVANEDEAIDRYKEGFRNFIVDIHMGPDRQQEGLNVLERLKRISSDNFVGILSGQLSKMTRIMARSADVVQEKTDDRRSDVNIILHGKIEKFLKIKEKLLLDKKELLLHQTERIDQILAHSHGVLAHSQNKDITLPLMLEQIEEVELGLGLENSLSISNYDDSCWSDPNFIAFQENLKNNDWFAKYFNRYVAFVDGLQVGDNDDELALLYDVRSKFPKCPRMIMKVEPIYQEEIEDVIEIPLYLSLEDIV